MQSKYKPILRDVLLLLLRCTATYSVILQVLDGTFISFSLEHGTVFASMQSPYDNHPDLFKSLGAYVVLLT